MLVELSIENLGVLPSATASWAPGLTVLTGETGAGKTFLLSGLKLIQGARADSSRVREGQSQAFVEGIFDFSEIDEAACAAITDEIENVGGDTENNEVVVSRSVSSKGRSRAHVGGRTVTAGRPSSVEVSPACVRVAGPQKVTHEPGSAELKDDADAERVFGGHARV